MIKQRWTIQAIHRALDADLAACQTEGERINVRALTGMEIRRVAYANTAAGRPLTGRDRQIAEAHGWRAEQ